MDADDARCLLHSPCPCWRRVVNSTYSRRCRWSLLPTVKHSAVHSCSSCVFVVSKQAQQKQIRRLGVRFYPGWCRDTATRVQVHSRSTSLARFLFCLYRYSEYVQKIAYNEAFSFYGTLTGIIVSPLTRRLCCVFCVCCCCCFPMDFRQDVRSMTVSWPFSFESSAEREEVLVAKPFTFIGSLLVRAAYFRQKSRVASVPPLLVVSSRVVSPCLLAAHPAASAASWCSRWVGVAPSET